MERRTRRKTGKLRTPRTAPLLVGSLLLACLPWIATLWEGGRLVPAPREASLSLVVSVCAVVFGVWVLVLLRRERMLVRRHLEEVEELTLTDPLTGLGNRRGLERDLARAMRRSRREDLPLSLLFLDVEGLKSVNDRFGHAAGDATLRGVGNVVRSCSRDGSDLGYRVGGDEFVIVAGAGHAGAEVLAMRLRQVFRARAPHDSALGIGVVEWDGAMSAAELINEADRRMYAVRHLECPAPVRLARGA